MSFVELLADKGRMGLSCPEDRLESTGLQEAIPKPLAVFMKVRREAEWSAGRGMYDDSAEEASSQWPSEDGPNRLSIQLNSGAT